MQVNKEGILEFLNEMCKMAVDCECKDVDKVMNLYCTYIDEKKENFDKFFASMYKVTKMLKQDLDFFFESDPAANNKEEILLAYPGYKAVVYYRIAHELYRLGIYLPARIITEEAHFSTGIDIHPGATIDSPFFIDHGTGRSTCILMNNSRLELLNALYVDVLFRTITDSSREALPVFSKIKTGEFF